MFQKILIAAKAKARRALTFVRREIHHVQALLYVLGSGAYQVVTTAGGYEAVKLWALKEWVGHTLITLGPALLFMIRGKHASADDKGTTP